MQLIYLVSDSTGDTVASLVRAGMALFPDRKPRYVHHISLRTESQITSLLLEIKANPGLVFFTFVSPAFSELLQKGCAEISTPCIPVLEPVISALANFLEAEPMHRPGAFRQMDEDYFKRINAMQFALDHDDGRNAPSLEQADVILIGVSRSSKTPTGIYLANRGLKVGNIPYIPGVVLSKPLQELLRSKKIPIFGLLRDAEQLSDMRRTRLGVLEADRQRNKYADIEEIRAELTEARKFFQVNGIKIIDVSHRSIEETASHISHLIEQRNAQTKLA